MKTRILSALALTFVLGFIVSPVFAAPPPNAVPIDGGLSLVIAVCAGYGAKKIYDAKKAK